MEMSPLFQRTRVPLDFGGIAGDHAPVCEWKMKQLLLFFSVCSEGLLRHQFSELDIVEQHHDGEGRKGGGWWVGVGGGGCIVGFAFTST